MYDLPPEHLETHYEYVVANEIQTAARGDVFQQFDLGITDLANQIKGYFPKGLKWGDIPKMFTYALKMLDHVKNVHNRKITALYVVDKVIDLTDTPFLPDGATDPIFKKIAHSLISYYFNHDTSSQGVKNSPHQMSDESVVVPADRVLKQFAKQLKSVFADGIQPADITVIVALSHEFTNKFPGLNVSQKRESVTQIMNHFIDFTDTPCLPDSLADPLLKKVIPSFVNFLVN